MARGWKIFRIFLGAALCVYAVILLVVNLLHGVNLIALFLALSWAMILIGLGIWLIVGPRKVRQARRYERERFQSYLDQNLSEKKLYIWSRWLRWAAVPAMAVVVYLYIEDFSSVSVYGIAAIPILFSAPSIILDGIVIVRRYKAARARLNGHNTP